MSDERFTLRQHRDGSYVIFREVLDPDMGDDFWIECERIATFKTRDMATDFMRAWRSTPQFLPEPPFHQEPLSRDFQEPDEQ